MTAKWLKMPDETPDEFLDVPDGLGGYWWETDNQICVPLVWSCSPGDGTFSRWLDKLESKSKTVFFPSIISARLESILKKRGYKPAYCADEVFGGTDGMAKLP